MFTIYRKELEWGGKKLVIETGKVARQADGAVIVKYGDTTVLATACAEKTPKAGIDFMPLTVHYQEKFYAAGRIPGGFFKREGRPTEKEVLISRLIDRPIRPLFPAGYTHETQVLATTLSYDAEVDADIAALIAASAALTLSGVPFMGPIGAAKVGYIDGKYVLNPTVSELKESSLELVVAGTQEGVLMVESEARELSEEIMLGAVEFGHKAYQEIIDAIIQLAESCAKEPWDFNPDAHKLSSDDQKKLESVAVEGLRKAYLITEKGARVDALKAVKEAVSTAFADAADDIKAKAKSALKELEKDIVRGAILDTGKRIDTRGLADIRPIVAEVGVLPRVHGSALFTRGETQALVVITLGSGQDEQMIDAIEGEYHEHFMLHYNFPPFSVGEVGRISSPGRREIGHGKLAWRSIRPVLPAKDKFPYTLRVVSEITESNGSSSMATVCGTSLAMMDGGVPLDRPIAGIAMGLIKEAKGVAVLSDILGDEDHLGDMDFKVAGTDAGITALQMDIKITSITPLIMKTALAQAKDGRLHILGEMAKALTGARGDVNTNAPKMTIMKIQKDKIREVIGTGGKVIREIVELSGAKIDIEDDGTIKISAVNDSSAKDAINRIKAIVSEPEVGVTYDGKVVKTMEYGAFVNFFGSKDGFVHISEMAHHRVNKVTDVVKNGDDVKVKVVGFDERGKVRLSIKACLEAPVGGEEPQDEVA
ncbi:MAG: polyribonucleotide nucleotidyltransferase [Alphaproteobacteria bacterium]|nr:polyribonucleotide nucleotidyltransferase [Alphaproteobacteria bacterium]